MHHPVQASIPHSDISCSPHMTTPTICQQQMRVQLETLRLSWCHLEDGASISAVADLLSFNSSLREVDLRGNRFGDDGVPACVLCSHSVPVVTAGGSSCAPCTLPALIFCSGR